VPFSPGAKKVFEVASRLASAIGREQVGTEHVLAAITRLSEVGASQILSALDIDLALLGAAR
jgi:ATP-dependent Clp protease ATP-binding subunit ClpA